MIFILIFGLKIQPTLDDQIWEALEELAAAPKQVQKKCLNWGKGKGGKRENEGKGEKGGKGEVMSEKFSQS